MTKPPRSPVSVVLTNVYSDDNRGGAAITIAHLDALRRVDPTVTIGLYAVPQKSTDPAVLFRHTLAAFPDVTVYVPPPARPRRGALRALRFAAAVATRGRVGIRREHRDFLDAPLVVGKGGQAFRGYGTLRGALSLWGTLFPLALAHRLGAVTAVNAVTVGPFRPRDPAAAVARYVLRRLDHVACRDERSAALAVRLGARPEAVVVVPDIVFASLESLRAAGDGAKAAMAARVEAALGGSDRLCAVSIKPLRPQLDDAIVLAAVLDALTSLHADGTISGVAIVLQGDVAPSGDDRLSRQLLAGLHAADVPATYLDDDLSTAQLCGLYATATLTLGLRLHAAILSLVAGCPAVAVESIGRVKAHDVLGTVGLADAVVVLTGDGNDAARLADAARAAAGNPDELVDPATERGRLVTERFTAQLEQGRRRRGVR